MERKVIEHFLTGKSKRWVRKNCKMGERRVRRIWELACAFGYLDGSTPMPPYPEALFPDSVDGRGFKPSEVNVVLLPHMEWMKDRLSIGWQPITVFEELPVTASRSSFYRFLHRHNLYELGRSQRRVIPEIVHQPGEALLLDWGKLRDVIDPDTGKKRTLWAFVGVLGFSRYMMVRLVWTNNVVTTLNAIESMFQEIGGVPYKVTSDNPKCFALEASKYEPLLNPAFERFADHYGTIVECLPPGDPQKKGKVERMMSYVRRLYQSHGTKWEGLEESQSFLERKLVLANQRKHGTTQKQPIEQFTEVEKIHLRELPELAYEIEEVIDSGVRKDGHIRFANKYYSVDEQYIGAKVTVLGNSSQISIYHQGKLIEVHERLTDSYRYKQTKEHHLKPWERAMNEDSVYRKRAKKIGPDVERFVCILLKQGQGFIDTRKIWGILSLDKIHSYQDINQACRKAIEMGSISYRTVKTLVMLGSPVQPPPTSVGQTKEHKFVRSITEYQDQLMLVN